jgi:NAD(P)-dependent dehydrogenase (short-subunit alcohol dehydrogenase family)
MTIADRAVLVTGANRGIGEALVEEALRRGATRVCAGTRQPVAHADESVTPPEPRCDGAVVEIERGAGQAATGVGKSTSVWARRLTALVK